MKTRELAQQVQERLGLSDAQMAAYIKTDVTTVRKVRMGVEDLPIHSKLALLDHAGFLKVTSAVLALLPKRARAKAAEAIQAQALTVAQQNALKQLASELKKSGESIDDDQEG
jgi:hypothetical protein